MAQYEDILAFEPHGHGFKSEGKSDGITVAVITKNKNHTHTNDGIYTVHILAEELDQRFREIEQARDAARTAFIARASSLLNDDTITFVMNAVGPRPFHTGHFIDSLRATRPDLWKALIARYGEGGKVLGGTTLPSRRWPTR